MPFSAFTHAAEAARAKGCHVFVQCLPKMGSTALSHSLHNAEHEVDMASAPRLMQQGLSPGFDALRMPWLQQRRQQLGDRIDVCTSLFLITAPLKDQQLELSLCGTPSASGVGAELPPLRGPERSRAATHNAAPSLRSSQCCALLDAGMAGVSALARGDMPWLERQHPQPGE